MTNNGTGKTRMSSRTPHVPKPRPPVEVILRKWRASVEADKRSARTPVPLKPGYAVKPLPGQMALFELNGDEHPEGEDA